MKKKKEKKTLLLTDEELNMQAHLTSDHCHSAFTDLLVVDMERPQVSIFYMSNIFYHEEA